MKPSPAIPAGRSRRAGGKPTCPPSPIRRSSTSSPDPATVFATVWHPDAAYRGDLRSAASSSTSRPGSTSRIIIQESYECLACRKLERPHIEKSPLRIPSSAIPSLPHPPLPWAMYQKYVNAHAPVPSGKGMGSPGHPNIQGHPGHWMILTAMDHLIPLKDRMARTMKQEEVLHADETPVQVMGGRRPEQHRHLLHVAVRHRGAQ